VKVLVTGAGGMLAREVASEFDRRGHELVLLTRRDLDVTDGEAVRARLHAERPGAVVHCAAYTAVDAAEDEPEAAFAVNAIGTGHVAEACAETGARLVYPSTDYVFDGSATRPYGPSDPPAPLSVYGCSKLAGERAALSAGDPVIIRTSWLYGAGGKSFVETMVRLGRQQQRVNVVTDQRGRPTWTRTLANVIGDLLDADVRGNFHVSDGGPPVTWFDFAREIFACEGLSVEALPADSAGFARRARRPKYSVLDCSSTEEITGPLPDWRDSLRAYLAQRRTAGHGSLT
jgi:dTDP-4-dehydrorhamnose reductase